MSQKRPQREETTAGDDKCSRKSPSLRSVVMDVMNLQRLQHLINPGLEPLVRRVVKEEVESALKQYVVSIRRYAIYLFLQKAMRLLIQASSSFSNYCLPATILLNQISRNCAEDACLTEMRRLQLQFVNAISLPVFTGTRIEGDACSALEIALVDVLSGDVVTSGDESSARVEIVVLEGDFDGDDGDNWTPEKFMNYIVREREGKKPLLSGDLILTLKDGTGAIGDLSFTDNSSWTRSRKFRLGARVMDDIGGVRIREAKSEPFVVRDHRGELYKKHHPPFLSDEVWQLEKIGKDGALHKRLSKEGVKTVQDFLLLLSLNPSRLRNILGPNMSTKKWEATVEHARTCVLNKTLYMYDPSTSVHKGGIVFNVIGEVTGVFINSEYVLVDKLSESDKAEAQRLVTSAFGNRDKIVTLEESALHTPSSSDTSINQPSPNLLSVGSELQGSTSQKISASKFGELDTSLDAMHSFYSTGCLTSYDTGLNNVVDPEGIRFDEPLSFSAQPTEGTLIFDSDSMANAVFCAGEQFKYIEDDLLRPGAELSGDLYSALNSFIPCPADKAQKGWSVLASVLRWRSAIKRIVARKSSRISAMP